MIQLHVKTTRIYLTNQLIQGRCAFNCKTKKILLFLLLFVILKFKTKLGLPFEGEIESTL